MRHILRPGDPLPDAQLAQMAPGVTTIDRHFGLILIARLPTHAGGQGFGHDKAARSAQTIPTEQGDHPVACGDLFGRLQHMHQSVRILARVFDEKARSSMTSGCTPTAAVCTWAFSCAARPGPAVRAKPSASEARQAAPRSGKRRVKRMLRAWAELSLAGPSDDSAPDR
jgi:hypothetical protein